MVVKNWRTRLADNRFSSSCVKTCDILGTCGTNEPQQCPLVVPSESRSGAVILDPCTGTRDKNI